MKKLTIALIASFLCVALIADEAQSHRGSGRRETTTQTTTVKEKK